MTHPPPKSLADIERERQLSIGRLLLLARRDFLTRCQHRLQANQFAQLSNTFVSVLPYIDTHGTRSTELGAGHSSSR